MIGFKKQLKLIDVLKKAEGEFILNKVKINCGYYLALSTKTFSISPSGMVFYCHA